jgi:hypothetical protein
VNNKDEEDGCEVVALFDSACREELLKFLPNSEIDRDILVHFLSTSIRLSGTPRVLRIIHSISLLTVSYALTRSTKSTHDS